MKQMMNRFFLAGLMVALGIAVGCAKSETSSADAVETKVEATTPAVVDAVATPVEKATMPENPETAAPKDHPAH